MTFGCSDCQIGAVCGRVACSDSLLSAVDVWTGGILRLAVFCGVTGIFLINLGRKVREQMRSVGQFKTKVDRKVLDELP